MKEVLAFHKEIKGNGFKDANLIPLSIGQCHFLETPGLIDFPTYESGSSDLSKIQTPWGFSSQQITTVSS